MTDDSAPSQRDNPRSGQWLAVLAKGMFLLLAVTGVWQVIWFCFISRHPRGGAIEFGQHVVLPILILGLLCIVATRHQIHWSRPLKKLATILPQVHAGEVPIEELVAITGPGEVEQIARFAEFLLRELRQQEAQLAELNEEMRQRIAKRTSALERTVGSLRQQATRDPLTGLNNRRTLDLSIEEMMQSCRANKSELVLLMIDVDNFKKLNDTLGHAQGDQFLRDIGGLVRSTIRASDMPFRMGGDEFLILLPDASHDAAGALATRLATLVDAVAGTLKVDPRPRLSIGLSMMSAVPDATPQALLEAADKLLYAIKSSRKFSAAKKSTAA